VSLNDCILSDDLAEFAEEVWVRFGAEAKSRGEGCRADPRGKIEMTLIEPQTEDVFKRCEGGPSARGSGGSRRYGLFRSGFDEEFWHGCRLGCGIAGRPQIIEIQYAANLIRARYAYWYVFSSPKSIA